MNYLPFWILSLSIIITTLFSEHKDLLRIQPISLIKFARTMLVVTALRLVIMYFFPPTLESVAPILKLPTWVIGMVWWEDPFFTLPLAIASAFLGNKLPARIIVFFLGILSMVSFGIGHLYQGIFSACIISLYIPYVYGLGKKHGFSTVILCHMAYDFITIMTVRLFLGL